MIDDDFFDFTAPVGEIDEGCKVESIDRRWYLVAVLGTSLSIVSIITNIIIAKVLLSSRHSHFFFLALLALSDCFLSLNYGPVIAMDIIKDRLQIIWLTRMYLVYVGPLLALCQVSMTFSCYLIILATIERYLITQRSSWLSGFRKRRGLMAFLMFLLAMLFRGPLIMETEIQRNTECSGLSQYYLDLHAIVNTVWYGTVYRFYIRNIMTTLVPFCVLAVLNYCIVSTLRSQQRSAEMFRFSSSDHKASIEMSVFLSSTHKSKIRSATRLMVLIVCSYLIANVINVGVTLWEYVSFQSTQDGFAYVIYETCTDVTSVLYILVCATRLFVYYFCNKEIRDLMKQGICSGKVKEKTEYESVKQELFVPSSVERVDSRNIGTDIDAVTIAIARHLLSADLQALAQLPAEKQDSMIISNYQSDEEPYMV